MVDNSKGADAQFAGEIEATLLKAGFDVEHRRPSARALFDTSVHFVVEGVAVRVPEDCDASDLKEVGRAIQAASEHRSARRRFRAVPVYRGETSRVLEWVDVFGADLG